LYYLYHPLGIRREVSSAAQAAFSFASLEDYGVLYTPPLIDLQAVGIRSERI